MNLAAAALVLALASPRPDWVDGMPSAFPRARYLAAVGIADDRAAAEARARAGIAASFESRVSSATRVSEAEAHATAAAGPLRAAGEARVWSIEARQEVAAATAKLLEGVEIADVWTDPGGRVHALAVLERARAIAVLGGRLAELDGEIAALGGRLAAEATPLARARIAHRLLRAAARRTPLADDLRILDPARDPGAPPAARDARAAAERALAAVAVAVRAAGEDADRLRVAATRAVIGTGLRVVAVGEPHELALSLDAEAAAPAAAEGFTLVRMTARVRGIDARNEAVLSFVEAAKGTSGRPDEAARRAAEALAARVEERLGTELRARLEAP